MKVFNILAEEMLLNLPMKQNKLKFNTFGMFFPELAKLKKGKQMR